MRRSNVLVSCFACLCAFAFLANPKLVGAQSPAPDYSINQLLISPAYQEIVLSSQSPIATAAVSVRNTTGQTTAFEVFAVEFPNSDHFGSLQNINFADEQVQRQQPSYITFDAQQFVLEPHRERTVSVRVSDRAQLRPGGNYAAVVIRAQAHVKIGEQVVVPALASQLLIRKIGGEVRNLSLSKVLNPPSIVSLWIPKKLNLSFTNNGNVHLIPRGVVTISDIFGRTIAKGLVNDASFYVLPNRSRTIPVTIDKLQFTTPIALLTLRIVGTAETTSYAYETIYLYFSPWLLLAVLLSGIFRAYVVARRKKHA